MRLVLQRVSSAAVAVAGERIAGIGAGLLVLAGVGRDDHEEAARRLAAKVAALRIFGDDEVGVPLGQGRGRMNRSLIDVGGAALVVSQFTLYANARKGYRPSFVDAARPELAVGVLEAFVAGLRAAGIEVAELGFSACDVAETATWFAEKGCPWAYLASLASRVSATILSARWAGTSS